MRYFGPVAGFRGGAGALRVPFSPGAARGTSSASSTRRSGRTRRGRVTTVLHAVIHGSPGPQYRPGAAHNAPCSILIHHDWPLMSHQAWTAPIVGTSQSVVAGRRQRPRVRRRHISRGSRDQTVTHPRSGPALSSAVAHRTARVPERMATSRRRRAERTSSPRCAVGAGRNYFDLGPMFSVCPAIFSSIQQRPFVLRGKKRNHYYVTEASFFGVRGAITWGGRPPT